MGLMGILRASVLCLALAAFHYPSAVVCGNDKETPSETSSSQGCVPSYPYGVVYKLSDWDDSQLAGAVLFIKEFCKEAKGYKFADKISDVNYEGLSRVCSDISYHLHSVIGRFSPRYGCGPVSHREEISEDMYDDRLKPDIFDAYAKWLLVQIPEIMKSYENMHKKCLKFTEM